MADMSELRRKVRLLVVRFIVWLTSSWLWQKFQLFMLRRIVRRNPSLVDRKIREVAREGALKSGRPELEEELVEWQKMMIDKTLQPRSDK